LKAVIELDMAKLHEGFVSITKVDDKGERKGAIPLEQFAALMQDVFHWEMASRKVTMISRFANSPFIAWGQNGARWAAVKEIQPAEYYLVAVASGEAYAAKIPRLVVRVSNYGTPLIYWTPDEQLAPATKISPLMISNISSEGRVCMGTTGLKCKSPDDIDKFIRQVIEAPADGAYLLGRTKLEKLYRALSRKWAPGIGKRYGITLEKLLARTD
jgi:hypothetical protein